MEVVAGDIIFCRTIRSFQVALVDEIVHNQLVEWFTWCYPSPLIGGGDGGHNGGMILTGSGGGYGGGGVPVVLLVMVEMLLNLSLVILKTICWFMVVLEKVQDSLLEVV